MKTKTRPQIQDHMTSALVVIEPDKTLNEAAALMRRHGVRHLPVVDKKGKLVGIVSQRDVLLVETLEDVDPTEVKIEEAMNREIYSVQPDEPLENVAQEMAEKKYGACVVANKQKLLGLFTTTDAMRVLATLLGQAK
jgi:acetoin utilization protein AcuB